MVRLSMLSPDSMNSDQLAACEEAVNGPRGKVPLPMQAWLRNPALARRLQSVGELLRFGTSLEPRLIELATLVSGRHWTAHAQWSAHKAYALLAGLDPQVISDIAARRAPQFGNDELGELVYEFSVLLLRTSRVPEPLYRRTAAILGEGGVVELVALLGYYCIASLTLNTFELGLPESAAPELDDRDYILREGA